MSNIVQKVKDAVHSHKDSSTTDTHHSTAVHGENPRSSNLGPHSTNAGNKMDPTVDSDGDRHRTHDHTLGATHGSTGHASANDPRSTNYGPHSTNLANVADPRVDSDHSGSTRPHGSTTSHTTGAGYANDPHSSNYGPHSTNLANAADPRVDSDRSNVHGQHHSTTHAGSGLTGSTQATGNDPRSSNYGPHSTNVANKADPRVDSDGDRTTGHHSTHTTGAAHGQAPLGGSSYGTSGHAASGVSSATAGSGTATNSGPHNSNLMNALDPRVDSDLDGSKTLGANKTYT